MSATAVVPAPSLRNDLAAGGRHFLVRARMTLRDPVALGVVLFAGVMTVPAWVIGLGIGPFSARLHPWPGGSFSFTGPAPTVARLALALPSPLAVLPLLLWTALVAAAAGGTAARHRPLAAPGRPLPMLPIGPRTRKFVEVLVAMLFVLVARGVVLLLWGERLGESLFGAYLPLATYPEVARLWPQAPVYPVSFVLNTVLGTLLVFPLVLAWGTVARLDWRGLIKTAVACLLLLTAASFGLMAHVGPALLVSAGLCAFLLVGVDLGERAGSAAPPRPLCFRASPGPLAHLRRDAWLGPLHERWLFLSFAVVVPLVAALPYWATWLGLASWAPFPGMPREARLVAFKGFAGLVAFLQWLFLLALPFFPFGLPLVRSRTPASSLFGGSFMRSWGALPVPREAVARAVYAHGLLASGLAWLFFTLQVTLLDGPFGLPLYELPAVFLMPAIVVCEAVGDRRRGFLAVAGLAGFQFGVPFALALVPELLPALVPSLPGPKGALLFPIAYVVGLVGALPPLAHLRGRKAVAPAEA